ncbi:MAG: Predicted L-lactate dehydrogenase, Iron-sulfur cluster-binding subunit YkgF, partial [uncultured Rubrobacteraceae bacterium]
DPEDQTARRLLPRQNPDLRGLGPREPARHPAPPQPRQGHPDHPAQEGRRRRGDARLGRAARGRSRPQGAHPATSRPLPAPARRVRDAGGRARPLGARRRRGESDHRRHREGEGRRGGRQGQVYSDGRDQAQRAPGGRGHPRLRDRPRRAHHPARRGELVAHPGAGHTQEPRGDPGALPQGARRRGALRRAEGPDERRPPLPPEEVPEREGRHQRGELRRRRDRHGLRRRVRGQREDVHDAAARPRHPYGHREDRAPVARLRGLYAAPPPLLDRGADEPLHLVLDRGLRGGRAAGVPPRPARQRPDGRAGGRDRAPDPQLHPVLGVFERLPRLRADRRPRVQLRLPWPHRRHPDAPARGYRQARPGLAALRVLAVRGVLPGLSRQDQHPRGPHPPARQGRPPQAGQGNPAPEARPRERRDAGDGQDVLRPEALREGPEAGQGRPVALRPRRQDNRPPRAARRLDGRQGPEAHPEAILQGVVEGGAGL